MHILADCCRQLTWLPPKWEPFQSQKLKISKLTDFDKQIEVDNGD